MARYEWVEREWEQGRGREEKQYRAGVPVNITADFFLRFIQKLFNKEILGGPSIFITRFMYIITKSLYYT